MRRFAPGAAEERADAREPPALFDDEAALSPASLMLPFSSVCRSCSTSFFRCCCVDEPEVVSAAVEEGLRLARRYCAPDASIASAEGRMPGVEEEEGISPASPS